MSLILNPVLTGIVRRDVITSDERLPGDGGFGRQPEDIADAATWGLDEFQILSLLIVSPILAIFFGPEHDTKNLLLAYVLCTICAAVAFAYVHKFKTPSEYVKKSRIRLFRSILGLRHISRLVLISSLIYAAAGVSIGIANHAGGTALRTKGAERARTGGRLIELERPLIHRSGYLELNEVWELGHMVCLCPAFIRHANQRISSEPLTPASIAIPNLDNTLLFDKIQESSIN